MSHPKRNIRGRSVSPFPTINQSSRNDESLSIFDLTAVPSIYFEKSRFQLPSVEGRSDSVNLKTSRHQANFPEKNFNSTKKKVVSTVPKSWVPPKLESKRTSSLFQGGPARGVHPDQYQVNQSFIPSDNKSYYFPDIYNASRGQKNSNERLRGKSVMSADNRKKITFPDGVTVAPGDRMYGIDSARSSIINSYRLKHKNDVKDLIFLMSYRKNGNVRISPLTINPLNDAYSVDYKAHLMSNHKNGAKSFNEEYQIYKPFAENAIRNEEARAGSTFVFPSASTQLRHDNTDRRTFFGALSKIGINFAENQGTKIFYTVDGMSIKNAFNPKSEYYATITSQELRHIHANSHSLFASEKPGLDNPAHTVRFIKDGKFSHPRDVFAKENVGDLAEIKRRNSYSQFSIQPVRPLRE